LYECDVNETVDGAGVNKNMEDWVLDIVYKANQE